MKIKNNPFIYIVLLGSITLWNCEQPIDNELLIVFKPTANPIGGNYNFAQNIALTSATGGADIHYTIDGTTPTVSNVKYSSPIAINETTTLKAIAIKSGMTDSDILTEYYIITPPGQVVQPTASPGGGNFTTTQTVTLSTITEGAFIFFTIDESEPTTASERYTSPITIEHTTTIKAMAIKTGMHKSDVITEHYIITLPGQVVQPTASPEGCNFTTTQTVTLSTITEGATIYFTLDESEPTTANERYTSPITIEHTTTVKAIAVKTGMHDSDVLTEHYIITPPGQVIQPTASLKGGNYYSAQMVFLSTATVGADIYYTLDGTVPTISSIKYSTSIIINETKTLKAISVKVGMTNSEVMTESYVIIPPEQDEYGNIIVPLNTLSEKLAWLQENVENGKKYLITINSDEAIETHELFYNGKTVDIILQGKGGMWVISYLSFPTQGSIFSINSGVTLTLDNNITLNGMSSNGSLVRINNKGKLLMNNGTVITGNSNFTIDTIGGSGGGVFIGNGGVFEMYGGEISNNFATPDGGGSGGGVFVDTGGLFTMHNGVIVSNRNYNVHINTGGTFIMMNGKINSGGWAGGGGVNIEAGGIFDMENGEISNNFFGVTVSGTFNMNGGEISGNTRGGVNISGLFNMNGGRISGNSSSNGGVTINNNGVFNMNDGIVSDNSYRDISVSGNFIMNGGVISNNEFFSNVEVRNEGEFIFNNGLLLNGGVSVYSNGTFTMHNGEISNSMVTIQTNGIFTIHDGILSGGGVSVDGTFIMNGGEVSGRTLDGIVFGGSGVSVSGTFTMNNGKITNNTTSGNGGGGVRISGNGIFTMYDGEITNNSVTDSSVSVGGGGVYLQQSANGNPTFIMHGGKISGNTVSSPSLGIGGGVLVSGGTFIMYDGEISNNTATPPSIYVGGGGVALSGSNSKFYMHGGVISGNTSTGSGGGVYTTAGGSLRMSGGIIYGNNAVEQTFRNIAADNSAALYTSGSSSQYGRFNNDTFEQLGTLSTTNVTINVENGILQ